MVAYVHDCDEGRLRRLLDGLLEEDEQDDLVLHLDVCEGCRLALDAMATDGRSWGTLREFLGGAAECEPRAHPLASATGDDVHPQVTGDEDDRVRSILKLLDPPEDPRNLGRLGPYEVLDVIGQGGMGIVLKASDKGLGRTVAIKVLGPERAFLASARRRFAREARAAASVGHEHVVAIHAVDSWKGLPYLVMQYVSGISLQERIDREGPLRVVEVLRIGMQVASGLAAAHAQGLVHRDIKPANILLENGVERVKITDFGLARASADMSLTQSGVASGTPQYMAPEQTRCELVDPRADLFSLGSVLYAMCTGHSPFRGETTMAVLRRVCEDTPRPIRQQNPDVPTWLEDLIAKMLAKKPDERFQSAAEVAELLGRCVAYLELPVEGPPPFRGARRGRGPRDRHRWAALGAGALLLVITLGAARAGGLAAIGDFAVALFRIQAAEGTLLVSVEDPDVTLRVDDQDLIITGVGPSEFRYRPGPHKVAAIRGDTPVFEEVVSIDRGGKRVVTITREGVAIDGKERTEAKSPGRPVSGSEVPPPSIERNRITERRALHRAWGPGRGPSGPVAESGRFFGGMPHRDKSSIEDVGELLRPVPLQATYEIAPWPFGVVSSASYSPDGHLLALGCSDGSVTLCDPATRRIRSVLGGGAGRVWSVAFAPDGKSLATASGDWKRENRTGQVRLWDVDAGTLRARLTDADVLQLAVAYAPDGKTLAWAGRNRAVTLWDTESLRVRSLCRGHEWTVRSLTFHPRQPVLVSAGFDGTIRFWDTRTGNPAGEPIRHGGRSSNCVAISPDGRLLAANSGPRSDEPGGDGPIPGWISIWDWETRRELRRIEGFHFDVLGVSFSPDGKTLASAGGYYTLGAEVELWDVDTGVRRRNLAGHRVWAECVAFSPDGKNLVSAGGAEPGFGEVRVWDLAGARPQDR